MDDNSQHDNSAHEELYDRALFEDRCMDLIDASDIDTHQEHIETFTVWLTPEVTAEWLKRNIHNRKLNKAKVGRFARQIRNGRWLLDGTPFRFSYDGILLDGQNRGHAIVETGISVPVTVCVGLDPISQRVMDTEGNRTKAESLGLAGEQRAQILSGILLATHRYFELGEVRKHGGMRSEDTLSGIEVFDVLEAYPHARRAAEIAGQVDRAVGGAMGKTVAGLFWMIAHEVDDGDLALFYRQLESGAGLLEDSPILALRNKLIKIGNEKKRAKEKKEVGKTTIRQEITDHQKIILMIKQWNLWRSGKPSPTNPQLPGIDDPIPPLL